MNAGNPSLPHVVVLGAGFAGLRFCQEFPTELAQITVVDRQNHHLFQPLLYQVATAGLSATDIAQPVRGILAGKPNVRVLMAEVTGFDLAGKKVFLEQSELTYDYLVIALGGTPSYFGHDEWAEHAPGLKTLDDALKIRRSVLLAYEQAETEPNEERRRELMTTVVVGGGPTGVELAGAFSELARKVLRKDFDQIDPTKARVILVEGGPRILAAFPPDLSQSAQRQLVKLGVEVRTGTRVQDIRAHEVVLANETIRAQNILWAAGVVASPLTKKLGVVLERDGRVKVSPDLSLLEHPEVFVLGDMAMVVDKKGQAVPGLSPAALQMGVHTAKVIARELTHDRKQLSEREPFSYFDKGTMATIGRSAAVAQVGKFHFSGYPAWFAWLAVHLIFLIGFRNKFSVLMQWIYSYLTYKRGARIITGLSGEKSAGSA